MLRRASPKCLLLTLAALTPLAAQDLGTDAPEIEWMKTFHFDGMPANKMSELRGSVILIDFWSTQSTACRRLIPRLTELHDKYFERGLVLVGVSTDPIDEVEKFVAKHEVKYPTAVGARSDYKVRIVPYAYLVDRNGKIVWRGSPENIDEEQLGKLLIGAKPGNVPTELSDAFQLRAGHKHGECYKAVGDMLQAGKLSEAAQKKAKEWRAADEKAVADALQAAGDAEKQGDVFAQFTNLDMVANDYAGVPGGDGAKERLDKLMADKKNQREVEGGKAYAEAEAKEAAFEFDAAHAMYKDITRKFGNTKAGKAANQHFKDLEKAGKLGYDHNCPYCKAGGAACPTHKKK